MEITFNNRTFDGKWQWLYFLVMDINDLLGHPFTFVIGEGNTFRNFHVDVRRWNKESTKYKFVALLHEASKEWGGWRVVEA